MEDRNTEPGRIPRTVQVEAFDDLVDKVVPGDEVLLAGIVRSVNTAVASGKGGKAASSTALYTLYLEANSIQGAKKTVSPWGKYVPSNGIKHTMTRWARLIQ